MMKLQSRLAELAKIVPRDTGRFMLTHVRLALTPDGFEVQATDGRRLAVVTGPGREEGTLTMLADAPNGADVALVPAKEFAAALKAGKGASSYAVLGSEFTTLAVGAAVHRLTNGDGRFPPIDQVLPKEPPAVVFKVNARMLAELLTVAATFSPDGGIGHVLVQFWRSDRPLAITTDDGAGTRFFGLMMPLA
jgi:hypothetical protein